MLPLIERTMGNCRRMLLFQNRHFQTDNLLPLFGFVYKVTITILIRAFQVQQGKIPDYTLLSSPKLKIVRTEGCVNGQL